MPIHAIIGQLKDCAREMLANQASVRLVDVVEYYRSKYHMGINLDWAAEHVEIGREFQVVELADGDRMVERWMTPEG